MPMRNAHRPCAESGPAIQDNHSVTPLLGPSSWLASIIYERSLISKLLPNIFRNTMPTLSQIAASMGRVNYLLGPFFTYIGFYPKH